MIISTNSTAPNKPKDKSICRFYLTSFAPVVTGPEPPITYIVLVCVSADAFPDSVNIQKMRRRSKNDRKHAENGEQILIYDISLFLCSKQIN